MFCYLRFLEYPVVATLSTKWGRRDRVIRDFDQVVRPKKRTIDDMTPDDVVKQKAERIKKLRDDIERYQQYIADAEAEIEAWESV